MNVGHDWRILAVLLAAYLADSIFVIVILPLASIFDPLLHPDSTAERIAALGVFVGLCTIAIVIGQFAVAAIEAVLVRNQGTILKQQHDEFQKRARLVLWDRRGQYMGPKLYNIQHGIAFTIGNVGDRAAEDCKIVLMLPIGYSGFTQHGVWSSADLRATIEGAQYARFELDIHRLIYPSDTIDLQWYDLNQFADVDHSPYYRLLFKDGSTPSATGWNQLGHVAQITWDE